MRNLDHSDSIETINDAELQLLNGENQLVECKRGLEELQTEAATRSHLEGHRDRLARSLEDPIFAERTRWDRERTWIHGQQNWVRVVLDKLPDSLPTRPQLSIEIEGSPAKAILENLREASERIHQSGQDGLDQLRKKLTESLAELDRFRTEWNSAFDIADNQYRARLAELGVANLAEVAAEHRGVEQELTRIETIVQPEIQRIKTQIAKLEDCRTTLLQRLKDSRSAIASSRFEFVKELNSRLGGDVKVDLSGSDMSQYLDALDRPLQGSGMIHREDQVSLLCKNFTPEKLVEVIRSDSVEQLTAIGITETNASRIVNRLTYEVLYKIERVDVPQLPSIHIKREGESKYTDLSSLSVGEKCSAILSIALLSKAKPLIIDQPEDDLDHAFIINSIVEGIRTAKGNRQIVAATHNPNVPVLGDAEMIFRVARRAGEDICYIQNSGGLELPQVTAEVQSLEGGVEAFERRRKRYSGVSNN